MEVKVFKLDNNLYQVEVGKRALVTSAKNELEALKKACKYLPIKPHQKEVK